MQTKYWHVDKVVDSLATYPQIEEAADFLRQDEVVAFPTETVYGLGGNALSNEAATKIFAAKGRPADNPLIVHIASKQQVADVAINISKTAEQLMEAFWPGPLTVILEKQPNRLSEVVTAGLETVAVRMPDHPVALAVIEKAGLPIAAPSANRSGKPSPTSAKHVQDDLDGIIAGIIDGGETGIGVESTVVDCTGDIPIILRPGGITKEEIEAVVGEAAIDAALKDAKQQPKSPGMKYKHYAPEAPVYLLEGSREWIQSHVSEQRQQGKKVGVLTTEENLSFYDADVILPCGSRQDLRTVAHSLYDVLRAFNETDVDIIYSETFPAAGVGLAIMNRLEKAAAHRWLYEK
ncbi:L-threonylcarbamoyladenylate synthase [Pseudobacillus wudalianchiensis]|uniref:Threonylcarbamoyl-AMP synthase n=1 Tax=Pseudobacillus wudalianchiensis TaxID=1743143 RepID=A0A1B9AXY5_9BACI|nr:L-threonylcarbamoyladenylate synthase [Bacillus wudalianchiensis]OCA88835.1 threonylcarbamoyl-AMP synthase [Bacillus wudalianchiensis]